MRRLIDIYRHGDNEEGLHYILGGLQQTGTPSVQCTPLLKSFTMANGTFTVYRTGAGMDSMTVELECSLSDADSIQTSARNYGSLIFANLHHMKSNYHVQPVSLIGTELFFTGSITSEMLSYKSDLCRVSLGVQMVSSNGDGIVVPAILANSVTIYGDTKSFQSHAIYHDGAYYLRQPIRLNANASSFQILFSPDLPTSFSDRIIRVKLQRKTQENVWTDAVPDGAENAEIRLETINGTRESMSNIYSLPDEVSTADYRLYAYSPHPMCKDFSVYFTVYRGDTE